MDIKISANLGFLWKDLSLPDAIEKASKFGFDAVECHWPFELSAQYLSASLKEFNMKMISMNAPKGDMAKKGFWIKCYPRTRNRSKGAH
jgi:hydroxypyruvate isomerase